MFLCILLLLLHISWNFQVCYKFQFLACHVYLESWITQADKSSAEKRYSWKIKLIKTHAKMQNNMSSEKKMLHNSRKILHNILWMQLFLCSTFSPFRVYVKSTKKRMLRYAKSTKQNYINPLSASVALI